MKPRDIFTDQPGSRVKFMELFDVVKSFNTALARSRLASGQPDQAEERIDSQRLLLLSAGIITIFGAVFWIFSANRKRSRLLKPSVDQGQEQVKIA